MDQYGHNTHEDFLPETAGAKMKRQTGQPEIPFGNDNEDMTGGVEPGVNDETPKEDMTGGILPRANALEEAAYPGTEIVEKRQGDVPAADENPGF